MAPRPEPVIYVCADCGTEITLRPGAALRCRQCSSRNLYKKRTPSH